MTEEPTEAVLEMLKGHFLSKVDDFFLDDKSHTQT